MGLEGSLKVLSLSDVFQMLGLQRKTGLLTVEAEEDSVRIFFLDGQIVSAESITYRLEDRLGKLLVCAGHLSEEQLEKVLALQRQTGERLGSLLLRERFVSPEDLREALRVQVLRPIYRAFHWTDGRFQFGQEGPAPPEAGQMLPLSIHAVLMEVAQITDEQPLLEKKIPSTQAVFRRAPGVESLVLVSSVEAPSEGVLAVSKPEAETWRWTDGKRSVADIMETAFLTDFEVLRGIVSLLERNLIVEGAVEEEPVVAPVPEVVPERRFPGRVAFLWGLVLLFSAASFYFTPHNPWNVLLRPLGANREIADLLKAVSLDRLVDVERAVRVYYHSLGRYPKSLEDLLGAGVLDQEALRDPYGRLYLYILRSQEGKFSLYGHSARGRIDFDLSLDRSLAPVSQMHPASARVPPAQERPGVQVVR